MAPREGAVPREGADRIQEFREIPREGVVPSEGVVHEIVMTKDCQNGIQKRRTNILIL